MSDTESLPLPLPAQSPYEVTHFPEHYNKYPQDLRSALLRTDNICASNKHSDADSSYVLIHEKVRESQGKSSWHKTMEVCSYLHDADWKLAMCFMKEYGAVVEPLMMVRKDSLGGSERQGELYVPQGLDIAVDEEGLLSIQIENEMLEATGRMYIVKSQAANGMMMSTNGFM